MRKFAFQLTVLAIALLAVCQAAVAQDDPVAAGWATFRDRFVTAEGRVVDTGNKEVSHTEGQGWAMLFAEAAGDRASFDKIWGWTREKLQRHDSALFAWRWDPNDGKAPVADANDATDGDILIAWALIRASRRWNHAEYSRSARHIVSDIRRKLIVSAPGRLVLLPGSDGFKGEDGTTIVNPSYYVFPALKDFARILPAPDWQRLQRDGLGLLADARFGRWGLTPDWVDIGDEGDLSPAGKFPARFGYDAIRVPLYLIWSGEASPERLASYLDFWNDFAGKPVPAWADVKDNTLAPYPGSAGLQSIVQLARFYRQPNPPPLPPIGDKDDYYSASLSLLAAVAQRETPR
jgi:endoglucanase